MRGRLTAVQNHGNSAVSNLSRIRANLDWQVTSRQGIDERLSTVQRRLQNHMELMGRYTNYLNTVNDRFAATDRNIRDSARDVLYRMRQIASGIRIPPRISRQNENALGSAMAVGGLFGAAAIVTTSLSQLVERLQEWSRWMVETVRWVREGRERQRRINELKARWIGRSGNQVQFPGAGGCHAFALAFLADLHGLPRQHFEPRRWPRRSSVYEIQPGDIVRYRTRPNSTTDHTIIITGVEGNKVTYIHYFNGKRGGVGTNAITKAELQKRLDRPLAGFPNERGWVGFHPDTMERPRSPLSFS